MEVSPTPAMPSNQRSLVQWMEQAHLTLTKEKYLQLAIAVMLQLTDELSVIISCKNHHDSLASFQDSSSSFNDEKKADVSLDTDTPMRRNTSSLTLDQLGIQLEDIKLENIVLSPAATTNNNTLPFEVHIQRPADRDCFSEIFDSPQLTSREVCFALGKILLGMLNSQLVDPLLMIELGGSNSSLNLNDLSLNDLGFESSLGDLVTDDNRVDLDDLKMIGDTNPRAFKKRTSDLSGASPTVSITTPSPPTNAAEASSQGTTISKGIKAKSLLQEHHLPLSICQLVCDLLEAEPGNPFVPDTALLSLEDLHLELMLMTNCPQKFLFDLTCPQLALQNTGLFNQDKRDGEFFGRAREMKQLMDAAGRINHGNNVKEAIAAAASSSTKHHAHNEQLFCEAIFLSGSSGMGKSSVIQNFIRSLQTNTTETSTEWFVITCQFQKDVPPLTVLLQTFNSFFERFVGGRGQRKFAVQAIFDRMAYSIIKSIDNSECFGQLRELIPCFGQLFPMSGNYSPQDSLLESFAREMRADVGGNNARSSFPSAVGCGRNRVMNLLRIIFKAVCSGGRPVLLCAEDLHYVDEFTLGVLGDFIHCHSEVSLEADDDEEPSAGKGGLVVLSSYREDEVNQDVFTGHLKSIEQFHTNISKISLAPFDENDINQILSNKLCLPLRHTRQLALLVHQKSKGHPLYAIELLRTAIHKDVMRFSMRERRWLWDESKMDDPSLISDSILELLTKRLTQLPADAVQALKFASCFGLQVDEGVIAMLDEANVLSANSIQKSLAVAISEGVMNKIGSAYTFSHDMLRLSAYSLIAHNERNQLHILIGTALARDAQQVFCNMELCALAVDQVNISCTDSMNALLLNPSERDLFARLNLEAGKNSMESSNFDQARSYFEAGILLLSVNTDHWDKQYLLSLELFEMSVVICCMDGKNMERVMDRTQDILLKAKSFEDTLSTRTLQAKILVYQEQYSVATDGVLDILSRLGEDFPKEISQQDVLREIKATATLLNGVTKESLLDLPEITDDQKLKAMKFMGLLVTFCIYSSPMLVHLLACRMMSLTFRYGRCEEAILGLAFVSHGIFFYSDDILQASSLIRIVEALIAGHRNEHSLRARLTVLSVTAKGYIEPFQAIADHCRKGYHSAVTVGDVDNAMSCGLTYGINLFLVTSMDLMETQRTFAKLLKQMAEHRNIGLLRSCKTFLNACASLTGDVIDPGLQVESNAALYNIAQQSNNSFLLHHAVICQMYTYCYFRENLSCVDTAKQYPKGAKRALDFIFSFYEGLSALCLARDTKQSCWKEIGEKSVAVMTQLVQSSTWNFENKQMLLQAELHYLNGRHAMAALSYQSSIISAREHKFYHEEALACELFGVYLVETKQIAKGLEQLNNAMNKYRQLKAFKKADMVKEFIDDVKNSFGTGRKF